MPKRLRSIQRRQDLVVRYDEDFEAIVGHCRDGRSGWLTDQAVDAYRSLYELGFVSTVGTYRDGRLVGGMWGIAVGRVFGLMSMFHLENHAGSLALAAVADCSRDGERWSLVDCGELKDNSKRYWARRDPKRSLLRPGLEVFATLALIKEPLLVAFSLPSCPWTRPH